MSLDHLTEHEIAGFLDQDLSPGELQRVREHLDVCDECRGEVVAVAALLATEPALEDAPVAAPPTPPMESTAPVADIGDYRQSRHPSHNRWRVPVGAAALLAAAVAVLILVQPGGGPVGQGQLQRFGDDARVELQAHEPADGSVVARESLRFTWSSHDAASYRISIASEDGSLVWSETVADTTAAPPASVELPAGETLFWYVDAITGGTAARTGLRTLTVQP
jgi:anti-sigma factor RsiW